MVNSASFVSEITYYKPLRKGILTNIFVVNDATVLLRDIAGDAASNAGNKLRPSGEVLNQIDRPADDNTWHDAPNFSKETVKSQLQSVYKSNPTQDAKGAVASGAQAARQSDGTTGDRINAVQNAASRATDQAKSNIDPETRESTKQTTQEYRARTKQYLSKKMPEERRDQTIWRLKVCNRILLVVIVTLLIQIIENGC